MDNYEIKEAGFGKRFLAFILDAVVVAISAVLLFSYVTSTHMFNAMGGETILNEAVAFQLDTGLYRKNASDQLELNTFFADYKRTSSGESGPTTQSGYGYENYMKIVYEFYTEFLPGDHSDDPYKIDDVTFTKSGETLTKSASEYYTWSYFCEDILGLPKADSIKDFTSEDNYSFSYYRYVLNEEGNAVDTTKCPVIKTSFQNKIDGGDYETISSITKDFYDPSAKSGKYADATTLVIHQSYYNDRGQQYSKLQWVSLLVAFLPIHTIMFLIIPLLTKDGKTLGKLVTGLGVIGVEGYSLKPYQRILHPLIVWAEGLVLLIPSTMMAIMAYGLIAVVDYMVGVMSKGYRQTIHDRLSRTLVVDAKASKWFADEEEQELYYMEHPEERPENIEESNNQAAYEDSVLDMNTLMKARAEREAALRITNFDEFERSKAEEFDREAALKAEMEMAKQEHEEAIEEPSIEEEAPQEEKKPITPPDEEGFTDDEESN